MTTALVAVYAPIGFMGGLVGTLFTEFAFSLAGAVMVSGIVALTLAPMMSSKLLKEKGAAGASSGRSSIFLPAWPSITGVGCIRSWNIRR